MTIFHTTGGTIILFHNSTNFNWVHQRYSARRDIFILVMSQPDNYYSHWLFIHSNFQYIIASLKPSFNKNTENSNALKMKGFTLALVCPLALKTFLWMLNYCTLNKKYCNNAFLINFTSPRKKIQSSTVFRPLRNKAQIWIWY